MEAWSGTFTSEDQSGTPQQEHPVGRSHIYTEPAPNAGAPVSGGRQSTQVTSPQTANGAGVRAEGAPSSDEEQPTTDLPTTEELDLDYYSSAPPLAFSPATVVGQHTAPAPRAAVPRIDNPNIRVVPPSEQPLHWWLGGSADGQTSAVGAKPSPPSYSSAVGVTSSPEGTRNVKPVPPPQPSSRNSEEAVRRPVLEHPLARQEVEMRMKAEAQARGNYVSTSMQSPPNAAARSRSSSTASRAQLAPGNPSLSYFAELALCDAVTCPLCNRFFKDPVTLPCGHSVCAPCLYSGWDVEVEAVRQRLGSGTTDAQPAVVSPTGSGVTLRFTKCKLCDSPVYPYAHIIPPTYLKQSQSLVTLSALAQRLVRERLEQERLAREQGRPSPDSEFLRDMKAGLSEVYDEAKGALHSMAEHVGPMLAEVSKSAKASMQSAYAKLFGYSTETTEIPLEKRQPGSDITTEHRSSASAPAESEECKDAPESSQAQAEAVHQSIPDPEEGEQHLSKEQPAPRQRDPQASEGSEPAVASDLVSVEIVATESAVPQSDSVDTLDSEHAGPGGVNDKGQE